MKLEIAHADTCLPCYWSGDSRCHVQVPVYHGMHLKELKKAIEYEIQLGVIAGNDEIAKALSWDSDDAEKSQKMLRKVYAAINRMRPAVKGKRKLFTDLEKDIDEDGESVYAFFIIREVK